MSLDLPSSCLAGRALPRVTKSARRPALGGLAYSGRSLTPALVLAAGLGSAPLSAAPLYTVAFTSYNESSISSATPFGRDSSYALPTSNGDGLATGHGYAMEGRVGATHHMGLSWNGGSGAFSSGTYAVCTTDDFIITGPAGPTIVPASLNLTLRSSHSLMGGYPGHGGHAAQVQVAVYARQAFWPFGYYAQAFGDFQYTNQGPFSSGVLAGQTGPILDAPFTLSANLPVNTPFAVELRLDAKGTGYGNFSTNPGLTDCDAGGTSSAPLGSGLRLASVNGQIMTLPQAYTLDAPSWGIVNNGSTLVAVGDSPPPRRLRLRLAGANPFAREARVVLDLPRPGSARVAVFDVSGRAVRTLAEGWFPAGRLDFVWDGRSADGAAVPPGLYFVRGECDGERATARLARVP